MLKYIITYYIDKTTTRNITLNVLKNYIETLIINLENKQR